MQATRTVNAQSVVENLNGWRTLLVDADTADIWYRGINDLNDLDRTEKIRFNMLASHCVSDCWFMYQLQHNEGLMADVNSNVWQDLFKHPGFREWLLDHRKLYTDDLESSWTL